jgi:hypothetical protein
MSQPNPYESPRPASDMGAKAEYMQVTRRPATPKVIGIIALVFGGLGLLGQAMLPLMMLVMPAEIEEIQRESMKQGGYSWEYMMAMIALGAVISLWLIASGIGLLKYRRWGRLGFNAYAVLGIAMALYGVYTAATQVQSSPLDDLATMAEEMETMTRVTGVVSSLIGMIFPVLGLIFLNRPHVKASLN